MQDSRPYKCNSSVKRRRICSSCGFKFLTEEVLIEDLPLVVKKDGRREPFSKTKILKGLQASCQKRAISTADIDQLVKNVVDRISKKGLPEVNSQNIGRYVMQELKKIDEVAYVRYASVYMTFKEVNEFFESIGGRYFDQTT